MPEKRIEYMDIYRGLGIVIMIMGHIGFGNTFDYVIHAFHMPMFFFVSGFFYNGKGKPTKEFILKKVRTLLFPYIAFGFINYLACIILIDLDSANSSLGHLFWINTDGIPIAGALWFLTALFCSETIYYFIDRFVCNLFGKCILVAVIATLGTIMHSTFSVTLPFAINQALVGVGFIFSGHVVSKEKDAPIIKRIVSIKFPIWLAVCIVSLAAIFGNGYINMRTEEYAIIPSFWINALVAIYLGIVLSKYIEKVIGNRRICSILKYIGRNSIVFVSLNQLCIKLSAGGMWRMFGDKWAKLPFIPAAITLLMLALVELIIASEIITKSKLRIIIGR